MEPEHQYILLRPHEDGHHVRFVTLDEIQSDYLDDLENIREDCHPRFLTEKDLELKGENPQYWDEHDLMILKVEKIIVPKTKVVKMVIEDV